MRSNPSRLFLHASSNTCHYQSTMSSHNDPRTWCHERKVRFLLKRKNNRAYHNTQTRDCFGPRYFSSRATLPQKYTSVQKYHLRIHTMTETKMVQSYYCLTKQSRYVRAQWWPWFYFHLCIHFNTFFYIRHVSFPVYWQSSKRKPRRRPSYVYEVYTVS